MCANRDVCDDLACTTHLCAWHGLRAQRARGTGANDARGSERGARQELLPHAPFELGEALLRGGVARGAGLGAAHAVELRAQRLVVAA